MTSGVDIPTKVRTPESRDRVLSERRRTVVSTFKVPQWKETFLKDVKGYNLLNLVKKIPESNHLDKSCNDFTKRGCVKTIGPCSVCGHLKRTEFSVLVDVVNTLGFVLFLQSVNNFLYNSSSTTFVLL